MLRARTAYVPALGFERLTRLYDPVVRLTTREATFKRMLLDQASLSPGDRVLDLGCGTGTLAIEAKARTREADILGLDGDPAVLGRARRKARAAAAEVRFELGRAEALPYADGSFDKALSSLFFHHLERGVKAAVASELLRILKPGGELHLADWGPSRDPFTRARFLVVQLFDGFGPTGDNVRGELPAILEVAGLVDVRERSRLQAMFGSLALYSGRRPAGQR